MLYNLATADPVNQAATDDEVLADLVIHRRRLELAKAQKDGVKSADQVAEQVERAPERAAALVDLAAAQPLPAHLRPDATGQTARSKRGIRL